MAVKVAINGFGRIGRLAFRQMFGAEGYEVVAINDLTSPAMLAHLLKYDTAQGSYCGKIGENLHTVEATEDSIIVDGKEIKIYAEKNAADAPWGKLGVDVVLECTGFYCSKEKSMAHIAAGAKKVVISAPAGNDLKTIVYNVNNDTLTAEDQIISAASCTTNCLAPMAKALNDKYPIVSGIMTTVHAYTGDQMILDGPHRKHGGRVQLPHGDLDQQRLGAPQGGRQGQQGKISACGCRHDLLQRPSCGRTIAQSKRFFETSVPRAPGECPSLSWRASFHGSKAKSDMFSINISPSACSTAPFREKQPGDLSLPETLRSHIFKSNQASSSSSS